MIDATSDGRHHVLPDGSRLRIATDEELVLIRPGWTFDQIRATPWTDRYRLYCEHRAALDRRRRDRAEDRRARKAALRRTHRAGRRPGPCHVCSQQPEGIQAHHVHPVGTFPEHDPRAARTVPLCPNCHALLHALARQTASHAVARRLAHLVPEDGPRGRLAALVALHRGERPPIEEPVP